MMYQEFSVIYESKIKEDFDYKQMADFILQQLRKASIKPQYVLDMGCGTGNASAQLVRYCDEMVLCDPSAEMLTLAREKFENPYCPIFLQGNAVDFEMVGRFDLIFSVLDIPNYLNQEELKAYLKQSWINLKPKGLMIFDLSSGLKLKESAQVGTFVYDDEDYFHVWDNNLIDGRLDITINAFLKQQEHSKKGADDLYERIIEEQVMHLHSTEMIEEEARKVGFKIRGSYDGYTNAASDDQTKRLVYVLEKGEN